MAASERVFSVCCPDSWLTEVEDVTVAVGLFGIVSCGRTRVSPERLVSELSDINQIVVLVNPKN